MLGLNDIRKGKMITLDGQPYLVVSAEFLRKQQRKPVVRSILKHVKTGQTREHSFQQSDKVPEADIERKVCQYLFANGNQYTFMDGSTYEQFELTADSLGDLPRYLLEGQNVDILFFEGAPVSVDIPIKVDRKVIEAPPGVRGDTSGNVMQDVTIEGGAKIKAPLFINTGDSIRIDTRDGTYVERV